MSVRDNPTRKRNEMRTTRTRYQQGTIRKVERAKGFAWEVRFCETVNGKQVRKTMTFHPRQYPTEASVRKAIQAQVALVNERTTRGKVDAKFEAITELYRSEHLPTLRHSTQQTNKFVLRRYIEPKWTGVNIRNVDPLSVTRWLSSLTDLAPTTKASIRSVMSKCFDLAALHGYTPSNDRNPMSLVKIKGTSKREKERTVITIDQFKQLVDSLPHPLNVMALLTGALGLRISETIALHWEDIDWSNKTITIQRSYTHENLDDTKTESSEAVLPLADELVAVLQPMQEASGDSKLLFPSTRTGGYRSASMLLAKGLQVSAKKLGLGRVTWHTLRHSCRSWLDANGVPVGLQKDLLRHADVSTTMNKYGRALPPDMRQCHEALVANLMPQSLR